MLSDKQKEFLETITEKIFKQFPDKYTGDKRIIIGCLFLQEVKYEEERVKTLVKGLQEYGVDEDVINCIREAYRAWCM